MPKQKTHDLYNFMQQISAEMATEYDRIQRRATEDPGTAGDQGEENWAELLRDWLPREYEVVTKGRKCLLKINFMYGAKIFDDPFDIFNQMSKAGIRPKFDPFVLHETP